MNMTTTPLELKAAQSLVLCYFSTTAPATNALNRSATARAITSAGAERNAARVYNTVLTAKGTAIGKASGDDGKLCRRIGGQGKARRIALDLKDVRHRIQMLEEGEQCGRRTVPDTALDERPV